MALNFAGTGGIFTHNQQFSEGLTQRGIRAGGSTVVVSIDGAGDAEAIQDAIKMLPDAGGVIYIKEGTYVVESKITINKPNVSIIGAGRSTILVTTSNIKIMEIAGVDNCVIQGIRFSGTNNIAHTGQWAISMNGTNNSSVLNNWLDNISSYGIALWMTPSNNIIKGNIVDGCKKQGITAVGVKNIITGNIVKNGTVIGIDVDLADGNIVANNHIRNNGGIGLKIDNCDQNIIVGNNIASNGGWGLHVTTNSDRNIITGNIVLNNTSGAILDQGTNTHPNGASGTTNLALDDLNIIA